MDTLKKLFTVEDIANMTSLTTRTIRNYLKDGSLKGNKIGGQWRFTTEDVNNFMENGNVVNNLVSERKQAVLDFIDGVNTDITGETQVCTIIDIYGEQNSTIVKRDKLIDFINSNLLKPSVMKFTWEYDEKEQKARYIIFSSPEYIIESLKILNQ